MAEEVTLLQQTLDVAETLRAEGEDEADALRDKVEHQAELLVKVRTCAAEWQTLAE